MCHEQNENDYLRLLGCHGNNLMGDLNSMQQHRALFTHFGYRISLFSESPRLPPILF